MNRFYAASKISRKSLPQSVVVLIASVAHFVCFYIFILKAIPKLEALYKILLRLMKCSVILKEYKLVSVLFLSPVTIIPTLRHYS